MMKVRRGVYALLLPGLLALSPSVFAQWPQFRGPNGSGVEAGSGYPVAFTPSTNVAWKASVPYGQSSPIVVGDRVYLTASDRGRLLTIALDAATGREVWRQGIQPARTTPIYKANDPASPTPAADAAGVVVFFADAGLIAYTRDGQQRWQVPLGPFKSFYGMGGSPIIAGKVVVLVCDQAAGSFVLAVDRATGRQVWKAERPGAIDAYTTPIVFSPPGGPAQVVVLGTMHLDAYAIDTGERRWWMPVGSVGATGIPVTAGDTVFASTLGTAEPWMPSFESVLAKLDGNKDGRLSAGELAADKDMSEHFGYLDSSGDGGISAQEWNAARNLGLESFGAFAISPGAVQGPVAATAVRWRFTKNLPYIPAPLLYRDVLYMVKDGGIITALDAKTGALLKEGRSPDAIGQYYASPVAADGKVYLANTDGRITVLKAAPQWEVLGVNDVGGEIHATPALAGGRIYVRTRDTLYCFGPVAH